MDVGNPHNTQNFTHKKEPQYPLEKEPGCAFEAVCTGTDNLSPTTF
jgi:hypothetical protein